MRIHQENTAKKLYRRVNTTTRHRSNNPGAEYRWERYKQKATDENMPQRASMHGKQKRGLDYSPLFMFLLTKVGQQWDEVYSHVVKRLDKPEPIFWMVALHSHEQRDYVRCGDTRFYHGLYVDDAGILQKVNPSLSAEDIPITCQCCTHTFNGVVVT
ncbi:Uncharacterised protein [Yersinia similis]|uniref:hypothetical protein n=1 Tax=Yersinia similis TaxID=367190 RepID=UPI0005E725F4|nr:hypothetical protein [Yersinia similis]CNE48620.1 Uncharacterised protein [Yersinia similis]